MVNVEKRIVVVVIRVRNVAMIDRTIKDGKENDS